MSLLVDIIAFLLLGLLGLETLRRLVRRLVPAVKDKYLDALYILILGFGVYLFFPKEVAERELREKQNRTEKALLSNQDELTRTMQELSKARAELTETQKQLKKEQQARLEIEEKLAWRNLSADQQKRIFAKLNKFPGTPFQLRVFSGARSITPHESDCRYPPLCCVGAATDSCSDGNIEQVWHCRNISKCRNNSQCRSEPRL